MPRSVGNQPILSAESVWLSHADNRLESLEKVRTLLSSYDGSPLSPLEKLQVETTAERFIGTSHYTNVENTLADLESWRQTSGWASVANILEGALRK